MRMLFIKLELRSLQMSHLACCWYDLRFTNSEDRKSMPASCVLCILLWP